MQYPFEFKNSFYSTNKTNPVNIYLKILMKNKLIFFKLFLKWAKIKARFFFNSCFVHLNSFFEKVGTRGSEYWMPKMPNKFYLFKC